jgi:hypothetical protein
MSPVPDQLADTVVRLCAFAPIIFGGLLMAMDPLSFRRLLHDVSDGIRRFQQHLQTPWQRPFSHYPAAPSPHADAKEDALVRLAGLAIIAVGLLALWELLR